MKHSEIKDRDEAIISMYDSGELVSVIAEQFNLTQQRVNQIIRTNGKIFHYRKATNSKMKKFSILFWKMCDDLDRIPTRDEMGVSSKTSNMFAVLRKRAVEIGKKTGKISKKELIEDMKRVAELVRGTPTMKELNRIGNFSAMAHVRMFGSLKQAHIEAGFDPNQLGMKIKRNV